VFGSFVNCKEGNPLILQNAKQALFAQIVAKGVSQTEAAKTAGYSEKTACEQGSRLARNVHIKARIEELRQRSAEQAVVAIAIDNAWVIQKLVGIVEKCTSKDHYAPQAANKSLELLGKDLGMFRDYVPLEVFNLMMSQMGAAVARYISDDETLLKIAADWEKITVGKVKPADASGVNPGPVM
jgi:hypothetical protein